MKNHKSHLLTGGGVVILLVSFVLSSPRGALGHDNKSVAPANGVAVGRTSAVRVPTTAILAARTGLKPSSVSRVQSPDSAEDLSIDASFGDENIALERKKHRGPTHTDLVIVKRVDQASSSLLLLRATITGDDAVPGSLLYGLAWLAGDPDPLGSVRALGYDIDVSKENDQPCTDGPPSQVCVERARRLATLLDATLFLGSPDERVLFRQSAAALGVAPDCVARTTQPTSPVLSAALPDRSADISIDSSLGDRQIVLEKAGKSQQEYLVIKLSDVIVTRQSGEPPEMIDLRATITGADRDPGSLLYVLAWLAGDTDPLGSVRALGYDINVSKEHDRPCTGELPSEICVEHARRLATLLDSTLALGSPQERLQFRQGAFALGIGPDCSAQGPYQRSHKE
jgi:hypothetical protein